MRGKVAPGHEPPPRLLDALTYVQLADQFGWTPRQVEEDVPAWLFDYLIPVLNTIREVQADESERRPPPPHGGAGGP